MAQNKTIEVFSKLSREQMQKLRDFVASPYHNKNESLLLLFDYLHKLYPYFPEEKITDAAILKNAKIKSSKGELKNKMTRLLQLTEDFLSFEYKPDPVHTKLGTLKAYKKLRLSNHFESLVARLQKDFSATEYQDFEYLWRKHRLEDELIEGFEHKIVRTADKTMASAIESLDHFHAVKKLRYMCDQANLKNLLGNPYADKFKQQTLDFIHAADLSDPYLAAYSRIYLCYVEEDDKKADAYFFELKKIVASVKKTFPKQEIRSLVSYMEIYCSAQANKGKTEFYNEFIEIIRFRIEQNMLLEEGQISPLVFKNIITCSLKLGDFEWTEKFINEYADQIPESHREDHSNYSIALLRYYQGKHKEVIDYLKNVSHNKLDILFSFAVRKLLLRAEIESGTTAMVHEQTLAYKKHLLRKKSVIGFHGHLLELFISYLEKLFSATSTNRDKIVNELKASENFAEKEWLLRMVQEKKL